MPNELLGFWDGILRGKEQGRRTRKMLIRTKIRRVILGGRILWKIAMVYEGNTLGIGSMGIFIAVVGGLKVTSRYLRKQKCCCILKLFLATWVLLTTLLLWN